MNKNLHWLDKLEILKKRDLEALQRNLPEDFGERSSTPTRFLPEIIQNADDKGATIAELKFQGRKILFYHNGANFKKEDVKSITTYRSPKEKLLNKIGKYGSGFKSIYKVIKNPEITSKIEGEWLNFRILNKIVPQRNKLINLKSQADELERKKYTTKFVFHLKEPDKDRFGLDEKQVCNFIEENKDKLLLFLPNIKELQFFIKKKTYILKKSISKISPKLKLVKIYSDGVKKQKLSYLVFSNDITLEGYKNKGKASVAYKTEDKKFIPEKNEKNLYVYFKTQENLGLKFNISAPFFLSEERVSIDRDSKLNQVVEEECAKTVCESIIALKINNKFDISFFELLPLRKDKIGLDTVKAKIFEFISNKSIWIGTNNKFYNKDNIIFGNEDYRDIFNDKDLKSLGINKKWSKFYSSHYVKALMNDVNIEEFNSNKLLDLQNNEWHEILKNKSHKKLLNFYNFLKTYASEALTNYKVIKSNAGDFLAGPDLKFPGNKLDKNFFYVDPGFFITKEKSKRKDLFKEFGVKNIDEEELILTDFKKYNFIEGRKIPISQNKYEKFLDRVIRCYNSTKKLPSFHSPFLIDKNLFVRDHEHLFAKDDKNKTKGLYFRFESKGEYEVYLPSQIDLKHYFKLLSNCKIKDEFEIVPGWFSSPYRPERQMVIDTMGVIRANAIHSIDEDWNITGLEKFTSNIDKKKSFFLRDRLNNFKERYFTCRYRANSNQRPHKDLSSSIILHLKDVSWIPDANGKYKRPKDLNEKTIDKNFFSKCNNLWLGKMEFNFEEDKKMKLKKDAAEQGYPPEMFDKPGEYWKKIMEKDKQNEEKEKDRNIKKITGISHRKPKDKTDKYKPDFSNTIMPNEIQEKKVRRKTNNYENEAILKIIKDKVKKGYMYHCQICIADKEFRHNSYSKEWFHREKILEGAHIFYKEKNEEITTGNILSLCINHHHEYSQKMMPILPKCLQQKFRIQTIPDIGNDYPGKVFELKLLDGEVLNIFFYSDHLDKVIENLETKNSKVIKLPA
jgi:hypothetical protein|tara:strand:+ start:244 stop:3291 length:3048 start_codon:yes stop_codon:yes gene_type:complete